MLGYAMPGTLHSFQLLLFAVAGWMNHEQRRSSIIYARRIGFCTHNSVHGDCASMTNSGVASR